MSFKLHVVHILPVFQIWEIVSLQPFIAEILLNQASPEMPISSSQHSHPSYGATADTTDAQSTNNRG